MRVIRLGREPTKVGNDVRAAISAWGNGREVLGGVALTGCTLPGGNQPVDALLVLPAGVIVVHGVDLHRPALELQAPPEHPWTADGHPMVRSGPVGSEVNPGAEVVRTASALANLLRSRCPELPVVGAVVAVGPYVEQVVRPSGGQQPAVRVGNAGTTSMLAAVRKLGIGERACSAEAARGLLNVLGARGSCPGIAELGAEGFPDVVAPEVASASTMRLPKPIAEAGITDPPGEVPRHRPGTSETRLAAKPAVGPIPRVAWSAALAGVLALLLLGSLWLLMQSVGNDTSPPQPNRTGVHGTARDHLP